MSQASPHGILHVSYDRVEERLEEETPTGLVALPSRGFGDTKSALTSTDFIPNSPPTAKMSMLGKRRLGEGQPH